MAVHLMVRRKKSTLFLEAKESTFVHNLKKMIEGITKVSPENQRLFTKEKQVMDDGRTLSEYGTNSRNAKAEDSVTVGLAFRDPRTGNFEALEIVPLSEPPQLPEIMRCDAPTQ